MSSPLLSSLLVQTYRRSDFAYRTSLLRELLEYTFFTKHEPQVTRTTVEAFITERAKPVAEATFLRTLPDDLLAQFAPSSFYEVLDQLVAEAKSLQTLSLTVPVAFSSADVDVIGRWVRENVAPSLLIEVDVDLSVSAGCRLVWNNQLRDFSFDHYRTVSHAAVSEAVLARAGAHT